jgi:hypothetical protein
MISTREKLVLQAHRQFDALLALVEEAKSQRLDCLEGDVFDALLGMGLTLVRLFVVNKGTGDSGPSLDTAAGVWKRLEHLHPRRYVSIFGELLIDRTVYGTREKQKIQAAPLDAQLGLPDGDFSYLLQSWLQERCLDTDYAGSIQGLAAILRVNPSVRSVEHMTRQMATDVPNFQAQQPLPSLAEQAQQPLPSLAEQGELLVATADHKGVPMVQRDRPTAQRDEEMERPGVKRAACAGAVYTTAPFVRAADDVLTRCGGKSGPPNGRRPRAKLSGQRWLRKWTARRPAVAKWCWPVSVRNWTAATRRKHSQRLCCATANGPCGQRSRRC